mmetsp:Transcript_69276/g.196297  ORF Transcript_69276/g.196297 Transcript_69276/m.196297 type:complete len:485 (-) Transcript_69276:77-1531(-)
MGQGNPVLQCCRPLQPVLHSPVDLQPRRLQELLYVLEDALEDSNGDSTPLRAHNIVATWEHSVRAAWGRPGGKDLQTMRDAVGLYTSAKSLHPDANVIFRDFSSFLQEYAAADPAVGGRAMWKLRSAIADDPHFLHVFLHGFFARRGLKSGFGTRDDLVQCLAGMFQHYGDMSASPGDMATDLLGEMPTSINGRLDVWEAVAHLLGRKKTPVELLLYDISNGASRLFSPLLLGSHFEAIYHSSVLAFNAEYWYGGHVFESEPPIDPGIFGPPLAASLEQLECSSYNPELQIVRLGYTLTTLRELRRFLHNDMKSSYRPENYDVLTHNCNHFSDDVVQFLTGSSIPEGVRRLPELLMSTPTARLLRPFLNRWLRGFQAADDPQGQGETAAVGAKAEAEIEEEQATEFREWDDGECGSDVDMGCFDPTLAECHHRRKNRRQCVRLGPTGELVVKEPAAAPRELRRRVRREAVRRLGNGQLVSARLV